MKDFRRTLKDIRDSWTETDFYLASCELKARTSRRRSHWQHLRHVNNQSHYVTMLASFEDYVNRTLDKCLAKQTLTGKTWPRRRAWEVLRSVSERSLPFMSRIAVLSEKGGNEFNTISRYYSIRNDIAHGQFSSVPPLAIPSVYADLLEVARSFTI